MATRSIRRRLFAWAMPGLVVVTGCAVMLVALANRAISRQSDALWTSQVQRAQERLDERRSMLSVWLVNYALWDELVDYIAHPDLGWEQGNLDWLVDNTAFDVLVVVDTSGKVLLLFFTLNREDFSFVIHLDRQPRTSRRREAQTGSRARSGSRSERTLDAVEHSRTLMEWWPFLIFHRGGLRIKVINNTCTRSRRPSPSSAAETFGICRP